MTVAWVAGVDEAGRGPLAGPVTAAAVILDPAQPIAGLNDSKRLSEKRRDALAASIRAHARAWAVVHVEVAEIDAVNILQATMAAMQRAVAGLCQRPDTILIDGNRVPPELSVAARAIVGGDASEPCISAASILAKTSRDARMVALDDEYPDYGFAQHKGYGTAAHLRALAALGPTPMHRQSFAPVRASAAAQQRAFTF
ncbi:ribonuclease HII [bacterium]|nr:ribonuclease HII [bacterium]